MISTRDYEKYSIIPPTVEVIPTYKESIIVIDSSHRDKSIYPSPSSYEIHLDTEINDVVSARLLCANVPLSAYLINSSYNRIYINNQEVILENGDYTITQLVSEIQTKINTVIGGGMTCYYDAIKDRVSFEHATLNFTLDFTDPISIGCIIGFGNLAYTSTAKTLIAPFRIDLDAYKKYVVLFIEQFSIIVSSFNKILDGFAIIPKAHSCLNLCHDDVKYLKRFQPPIQRLSKFKIAFYDQRGNLYDFQNMDHYFEIILNSHSHQRRQGTIFS
jgi:hypothetical protein